VQCSNCRYLKAFLAFTGCNIGLATVAGSLCALIAPAAAGSGIPEVKAYLNGVDAPSVLAPSTLLVKVNVLLGCFVKDFSEHMRNMDNNTKATH